MKKTCKRCGKVFETSLFAKAYCGDPCTAQSGTERQKKHEERNPGDNAERQRKHRRKD